MKKYLLIILNLILLTGCIELTSKEGYRVIIYDLDGEVLKDDTYDTLPKDSLFIDLKTNYDIDYTESSYGIFINKIDKQITDPNYYCAIYINDQYAQTGISEIKVQDQDVISFKMECFNTISSGYGTMDEYDILVDKLIYSYAKTYMQDRIKNDTSFTTCDYWHYMMIYMMDSLGYNKDVFNLNNVQPCLINSVIDVDLNTLTGINLAKYYYVARVVNHLSEDFISVYTTYLNDLSNQTYNEYLHPFTLSIAKGLNIEHQGLNDFINTDYLATTTYGYDGLNWQITSLNLFNHFEENILDEILLKDLGNGVSNALCLLSYASFNLNIRDNLDMIKILIDHYYNEELNLITWQLTDSGVSFGTSQIYASLCAYKAQRDLLMKVNIFA